jgi:hypothetical protein
MEVVQQKEEENINCVADRPSPWLAGLLVVEVAGFENLNAPRVTPFTSAICPITVLTPSIDPLE